jgi:ElaB/YqjD/DUF883 family membrane-anchored ribosome-binding protein
MVQDRTAAEGGMTADATRTAEDVAQAASDTTASMAGQAREAAARTGEAVWQTTRDAGTQMSDRAGQVYDVGRRAVQSVGRQAEEHVWATFLTGMAVGCFLGFWLAASRR